MKGFQHERTKCKFCAQDISSNAISRHEKVCAKSTDEEREQRNMRRDYAESKRERHTKAIAKRPYHRRDTLAQLVSLNGNGKRLAITLSLPVRTLMQLLPSINLDKVEVV